MRNRLLVLTFALIAAAVADFAAIPAVQAGCTVNPCQPYAGYGYGYAYAQPVYRQPVYQQPVYQPAYQEPTGALPVPPPPPFYYSYSRAYESGSSSWFGGLFDCGNRCAAPASSCCATSALSLGGTVVAAPAAYAAPAYAEPAYSQAAYAQPAYAQPAYAGPVYAQPTYAQPAYAQPAYASGYPQQNYFQQAYPYPEPAFAQRGYANMEAYAEPGASRHRKVKREHVARHTASPRPKAKPSSPGNPSTALSGREVAPGRVLTP
jgi:hypothetical protein